MMKTEPAALQPAAGPMPSGAPAPATSPEPSVSRSSGLRIGHGYDVHKLVEGRPLIVGGVTIAYEKGLLGHSDADVLTHAIMDALLGAARLGDLGKLFPDTDPAFKGANSLDLLREVARRVEACGFDILDIDSTIAAQAPKMAPHIDQMRHVLATTLGLDIDQIGIKATTTEHLGFVGRGEGMSAWSVALLAQR